MHSKIKNEWEFYDDFIGGGTFVSSAGLDPWVAALTGTTPTATRLDHGETAGAFRPGVAQLLFVGTDAQNACLSFGDKLAFDINKLRGFACGLKFVAGTGGAKDTTTTVAWGVTGDRNDAIDTIAIASIFRLASTSTDHAVVTEADDATANTLDDQATGFTLTDNTWADFYIDFSNLADVKYYAGFSTSAMNRVSAGSALRMDGYSAAVQPFFQIQKTTDTNTDSLQIDYVRLWGVR